MSIATPIRSETVTITSWNNSLSSLCKNMIEPQFIIILEHTHRELPDEFIDLRLSYPVTDDVIMKSLRSFLIGTIIILVQVFQQVKHLQNCRIFVRNRNNRMTYDEFPRSQFNLTDAHCHMIACNFNLTEKLV